MAYEDLLLHGGGGYDKYRLTGQSNDWLEELASTAEALSWNKAAYTSEVRFTDRVLKFHTSYWNEFAANPLPDSDFRPFESMKETLMSQRRAAAGGR